MVMIIIVNNVTVAINVILVVDLVTGAVPWLMAAEDIEVAVITAGAGEDCKSVLINLVSSLSRIPLLLHLGTLFKSREQVSPAASE